MKWNGIDLMARKIIMSCCLYYRYGANVLPDHEFDALCREVAARWDELSPLRQWQLGSPEALRASGNHVKVTAAGEAGALQWHLAATGDYPVDWTTRRYVRWKFSKKHQVSWASGE